MKILGICGEPGTGKTSLMRDLMDHLGRLWVHRRFKTLDHMVTPAGDFIVLGKYVGEYFDGTDRLSMAVINDAELFLTQVRPFTMIMFEGDRLFCTRFLNNCLRATKMCRFIQLGYDNETFHARRDARLKEGINQSAAFILSRRTKYSNLRREFPLIELRMNRTIAEKYQTILSIKEWIK